MRITFYLLLLTLLLNSCGRYTHSIHGLPSPSPNTQLIIGKVNDYSSKKSLDYIQIVVMKDSRVYLKKDSISSTQWQIELPFHNEFTVIIGSPGFASKSMIYDTRCPENKLESGITSAIELSLFKFYGSLDYSPISQPISVSAYNPEQNMFLYNVEYFKEMAPIHEAFKKKFEAYELQESDINK